MDSTALFGNVPGSTEEPAKPAKPPTATPTKTIPPASLNAAQQQALNAMQRKLEITRHSPNTIKTYLNATKHLFLRFPQIHPADIGTEDIEAYQHHMATERKVSNSYLDQVVHAVRYYY